MKRILPIALVSIVLAALAAWHYGGNVDSSRDGNVAPATPARTWSEARIATPESRPDRPASVGPQAAAGESVTVLAPSGVLPEQPAGTTTDPSTGAALAWQAPEDEATMSSSVGVPPADGVVDPATGAVVMWLAREDGDATASPGGALPGAVEIDQATGIATSR